MKKVIFTLLGAALTVAMFAGHKTLTISSTPTAPKIDAVGDDDCWATAEFQQMDQKKGEAADHNNKSQFKLLYTHKPAMLFVYAEMEDAKLDTAQSANAWEKDCLEVFVSLDTTTQAAASNGKNGFVQYRKVYGRDISGDGGAITSKIQAIEETSAAGFNQEWAIPFDTLAKTLTKAESWDKIHFRFEIQNGDNDGAGRKSQNFWNANTDDQWSAIKNQGTIVLKEKLGDVSIKGATVNSSIVVKGNSIEFANASDVNVYDITGKLVIKANNVNSISTAALKSGVYVVKANNEAKKFIK